MLSEDRRDVSSIVLDRGYVVRVKDVGCCLSWSIDQAWKYSMGVSVVVLINSQLIASRHVPRTAAQDSSSRGRTTILCLRSRQSWGMMH